MRAHVAQVGSILLALVVLNRIVDLRAASPRCLEPQADLDSLDGLHGHHGLGQPAVELYVPLRVRSQPERQAFDAHFENPAERVALFAAFVDQVLDLVDPGPD